MTRNETETYGRDRLLTLDLMRGVAAMTVAISHASAFSSLSAGPIAAIYVGFFFILSGFVLAHAYGAEIQDGRMSIKEFAVVRLARLYPLHILTTAFVAAFWAAVEISRLTGGVPHCGLRETIEAITLTHFLFGGGVCFNTPSWSISVELWGSFLVFALCRPVNVWIKAVVVAVLVGIVIHSELAGGFLDLQGKPVGAVERCYGIGFACFVYGWAIHAVTAKAKFNVEPWMAYAIISATTLLVAVPPIDVAAHPNIEVPYLIGFGVVVLVLSNARLRAGPARSVAILIGNASYGIYLWHVPLLFTLYAIAHLTGLPIVGILFIPTLIGISVVSFKLIETPAKRRIRNFFLRR